MNIIHFILIDKSNNVWQLISKGLFRTKYCIINPEGSNIFETRDTIKLHKKWSDIKKKHNLISIPLSTKMKDIKELLKRIAITHD